MRVGILISVLAVAACGEGRPGPWSTTKADPIGAPALKQAQQMSTVAPKAPEHVITKRVAIAQMKASDARLRNCKGLLDSRSPRNIWEEIGKDPQIALQIYQLAISRSRRVELGINWWEELLEGSKDVTERAARLSLHIKGDDGSYTDFILPRISAYIQMYEQEISANETPEQRRAALAEELFSGVLDILRVVDKHIAVFDHAISARPHDSNTHEQVAALLPASADYRVGPEITDRLFPEHNVRLPGFFSSQIEVQKEDRSYQNYHVVERQALMRAISKVTPRLSLQAYRRITREIDGPDNRIGHFFHKEK